MLEMKGKPAPVCICCDTAYTIKHIHLDLMDFADALILFYTERAMFNLIGKVTRENL